VEAVLESERTLSCRAFRDISESRQLPSRWERIQRRRGLAGNEIFRLRFRLRRSRPTARQAAPLKMTAGERAGYHGDQCGRVFASDLIAKNPRTKSLVVEKTAASLSPFKNIGVFDANLGD